MVYECERCEAVLRPGLIACPRCGLAFDEPVPSDAVWQDDAPAESTSTEDAPAEETRAEEIAPPEPPAPAVPPLPVPAFTMPAPRRRAAPRPLRLWAVAVGLAVAFAAVWYPPRPAAPPAPTVAPAAIPAPLPPAPSPPAHPGYPGQMTALLGKLRATGVAAQWPALGSRDVLLVSPPESVGGQRTAWSPDLYRALAQGVYADFVFHRYASGFSDTDSTTCFVVVTDPGGKAVAVDFMGQLK